METWLRALRNDVQCSTSSSSISDQRIGGISGDGVLQDQAPDGMS
jgi:hypothetical protein